MKPSAKPAPLRVKIDTLKVSEGDIVVNQLLARHYFERVKNKLELFDVTVHSLTEGGVQITGDTDEVKKARVVLHTEIQLIKSELVTGKLKFNCSNIPQFADPHMFQEIERKYSVELMIIRNNCSEEKLLVFSGIVAAFSKKSEVSEPLKCSLFDDYYTSLPACTEHRLGCLLMTVGNLLQ